MSLLDPLSNFSSWASDAQEYTDEAISGVVGDEALTGPTAETAQSLADLRQVLLNQLAALDDYIDEVEPSYAAVGGIPAASPFLVAGVPLDDPGLQYLTAEFPGGVTLDDRRLQASTFREAVRYIERSRNSSMFFVFYDEGTDTYDVYIFSSDQA